MLNNSPPMAKKNLNIEKMTWNKIIKGFRVTLGTFICGKEN